MEMGSKGQIRDICKMLILKIGFKKTFHEKQLETPICFDIT